MKITVIGGGNIGTLMAGEMAFRGHDVTVFSSKPERWSEKITILGTNHEEVMTGQLKRITDNLEEAVRGAQLIWITLPAQMFAEFAKKMIPYVEPGQMVGIVPGSGGAEFAFRGVLDKGGILFGLQRVHSIARLKEYGHSVYMLGRKKRLEVGTIPADKASGISELIQEVLDMPCIPLPNYLCVTLTPSNPILHTTRLYTMFRDYVPGMVYPKNFLFYEEWTNDSSEMLLACDAELQELCNRIPLELQDVVSLRVYYESDTPEAMTKKISGILAFQGLESPMLPISQGWVPDFQSRYFTTDFPYGLKLIRDVAHIFGMACPNIQRVWDWYCKVDPEHAKNALHLETSAEAFVSLYSGN